MVRPGNVQSILSCMLKNGQIYFKIGAVFTPQDSKVYLVIFNVMHERINTSLTNAKHRKTKLIAKIVKVFHLYHIVTTFQQEKIHKNVNDRMLCVQYFEPKPFPYSKLYTSKIKNENIQSNFWIILMKSWNTSWNTHFIYCPSYLMLDWANLLIFWLESCCQSFILPVIN